MGNVGVNYLLCLLSLFVLFAKQGTYMGAKLAECVVRVLGLGRVLKVSM